MNVFAQWANLATDLLLWCFQWIEHLITMNKHKAKELALCLNVANHILSDPFMALMLIQGFGDNPLQSSMHLYLFSFFYSCSNRFV